MQQKQQTGCQYKYKFYSIYSNHVRISNIKDDLNAFFLNTAFQVEKPSHTKLNSILNVGNFALYCRFGWWYIRMHNLYHHTSIFFFFREANKMRFDPAESKKKSARFTTHSFNIEWAAFETHCYSQSHGRCSNNKNNNNNNINRK